MKSGYFRIVLIIAFALIFATTAACSSNGTTLTSAPTTPAATTTWTADAQYVYRAMEAQVTGYIAVALDPDIIGGKTDTDMLFGYVAGSQAFLFDQWARTEAGENHPDDTALGGVNNIVEFGGSETGGITVIEFKRLLNTGDQFDHPFVTGAKPHHVGVHNTSDDLQVHTAFGRGTITIS